MGVKKAKVLYDYTAVEDDELNLQVGDIIAEVEPADTGWCKGLLNGKRGMFPDNFVQILEHEEKSAPAPPSAQKKPSKKSSSSKRKVKATFPYTADNGDELSLEVGDIVEILRDVEEGWAEGSCKGKVGVFPTNFVEPIPESSESEESGDGGLETKTEPAKEEAAQNDELLATSSQKKIKGVGFGNIFGDGPIKLRQRSIGEADKKKNMSTPSPKPAKEKDITKDLHATPVSSKSKKATDYCLVMFDYPRENDDELSLIKGEIVTIVDREGGDDGWWEGEKMENGKKMRGVFPDNFVNLLTPEQAREHEKELQAKLEPESKTVKSQSPKDVKSVSMKKAAPLLPPPPSQGAKPQPVQNNTEVDHEETNDAAFTESATTDHTLTHMKRPAGPRNRRKPGANERREKAQATEITEQNGEEVESEEEKPEIKPAPKKENAKRGVAVLPTLGGAPGDEGAPAETPSWLQNLRTRQSSKRPPPGGVTSPTSSMKEPSPTEMAAKPSWLQNLKKRQSSEFPLPEKPTPQPSKPEKVALHPPKPAEKAAPPSKPVDKPAMKPANGHVPPAKPAASVRHPPKPAVPAPSEKPLASWQVERQQKARKTKPDSAEDQAPEPPTSAAAVEPAATPAWKNSLPRKSATVQQVPKPTPEPVHHVPAKKVEKAPYGGALMAPAIAVKMKPAPPKGKPAPAAKPASSTAVEEMKEELKHMKEDMAKIRDEMKKEISKLSQELHEEKKQRISLQAEIGKLRQQMPS